MFTSRLLSYSYPAVVMKTQELVIISITYLLYMLAYLLCVHKSSYMSYYVRFYVYFGLFPPLAF